MPRTATRSKSNQAQTTPSASPASKPAEPDVAHAIDPKDHEAALARVAELKAEVAAQKAQLAEASKEVAESVAKAKAAAEVTALNVARLEAVQGQLEYKLVAAQKTIAEEASRAELEALKVKQAHEEALKATVQEAAAAADEALKAQKERLENLHRLAITEREVQLEKVYNERDAVRDRVAALEKQLAARAAPSGSRKKQKSRSNWPRPGTKGVDQCEDDLPDDEFARAFVDEAGIVPRTRGPAQAKVDLHHSERPFVIAGSGAEEFFGSLNVTDKATLHKVLYESGYVWVVASLGDAPYNANKAVPCKFRDVLEYLKPGGVYAVGDKTCNDRKVWLAAHLWPDSDVLARNKISCLSGGQQAVLKKFITGVNQVTHFYNEYMLRQDPTYTPIATSAPPPSRKSAKRAREDEDEDAETEAAEDNEDGDDASHEEQAQSDDDGPSTPKTPKNNDEEMPEAVMDAN